MFAVAFMASGRWVARCPVCGTAERAGRCEDGQPGGLEADRFTCVSSVPSATALGFVLPRRGCGWQGPVEWPSNITDLERVLLARPAMATRNWVPGETLWNLIEENAAHGIIPAAALDGGGEWALQLANDEPILGNLEFASIPLQIGSS